MCSPITCYEYLANTPQLHEEGFQRSAQKYATNIRSEPEDVVQDAKTTVLGRCSNQQKFPEDWKRLIHAAIPQLTANEYRRGRGQITVAQLPEKSNSKTSLLDELLNESLPKLFERIAEKAQLSDLEKNSLYLKIVEGLSNQQIADELGVTKKQVNEALRRARKKISEAVGLGIIVRDHF